MYEMYVCIIRLCSYPYTVSDTCMHYMHLYTIPHLQMGNKIAHAGRAVCSQFHGHEVPALLLAKQVGENMLARYAPYSLTQDFDTGPLCLQKVCNNRPAQQKSNIIQLTTSDHNCQYIFAMIVSKADAWNQIT